MNVAIPVCRGRVSPVFDVARELAVVEVDGRSAVAIRTVPLVDTVAPRRVRHLAGLGIEVLICGAVSRALEEMLQAAGIRVLARRCGAFDDVLAAYLRGQLHASSFRMPGCAPQRRTPAASAPRRRDDRIVWPAAPTLGDN
jgi:predicted Fe-Mo cluster-binding NifX family protein